jgi:CDP-diacylglycerol--glycerol-3-phosphate 3-phosphatidyltransferase
MNSKIRRDLLRKNIYPGSDKTYNTYHCHYAIPNTLSFAILECGLSYQRYKGLTMTRKQLTQQLVRAACGGGSSSSQSLPLRRFALHEHHFGNIGGSNLSATPSDFHSHLCQKIRHAQERVILASLYIGVGSRATQNGIRMGESSKDYCLCKEDEFLQSLYVAASNEKIKQMQIILDANRAMRKVSLTNKRNAGQSHDSYQGGSSLSTNSADTVLSTLKPFIERREGESHSKNSNNGLFLFPVNDQRMCAILPSPLDEVAGVFHIKAYLVDDELILSGANLSEEYFSNRLDRYMLFNNGGGGLVDFYADLCDTLCSYAIKYDGQSSSLLSALKNDSARKQQLESSLTRLFVDETHTTLPHSSSHDVSEPVAYAIPTFQMPKSFLGRPFQFQPDVDASRNLLLAAVESEQNMSVRLSSAYLNLTPRLTSLLTMFGNKRGGAPYVLTAGAMSHGFAPKKKTQSLQHNVGLVDRIKASIPEAFLTLVKEASQSIVACGGKVLLYQRPGWTFHAKGVWLTANDTDTSRRELIDNPSSVVSTIIGSGNYGARSEDLDVESNCIVIFNESSTSSEPMKQSVASEWNNMCKHSTVPIDLDFREDVSKLTTVVVQFMKKFL